MKKTSFAAVIFLAIAFCAVSARARGTAVFTSTVDIGWFGIERSYHTFAAEDQAEGILQITGSSSHRYYFGYVCLNHNWHSFSSRNPLSRDVILKRQNSIYIILFGQRNAAADITVIQKDVGPLLPVVSISAEPETIAAGGSATLGWQSQNADTASIDQGIGEVDTEGSTEVSPAATTTYTISAAGAGGSATDSVTVAVTHPPSICVTEPDGSGDEADKEFRITWTDADPDSNAEIALYADSDNKGGDGTRIAAQIHEDPDGPGDEYLWDTAAVPEGERYIYAVIDDGVHEPAASYSAGPVTISHPTAPVFDPVDDKETTEGREISFTVHAEDADGDTLAYSASNLPAGADFDPQTQRFSWIPAAGQAGSYHPEFRVTDGSLTDSLTVGITVTAHPPAVTLTADPAAIDPCESSTLSWSSEYADTCTIEPEIGEVDENGSVTVSPEETTTYTITAAGAGGTASDEATVTTEPLLATMTGTITDTDTGEPLEGAAISVAAGDDTHSAETGADGTYEIQGVAPGDIVVTIVYSGLPHEFQATLPTGGVHVMDFSVHANGLRITGTVADSVTEEPLAEATVTAVIGGQTRCADVRTDGSYEISGITASGRLKLTASCPGYLDQGAAYSVGGAGVLHHDFALCSESATASVTGVITNAGSMQPEAGVNVALSGQAISDITDSSGTFTLPDVPMGPQRLKFCKEGFIRSTVPIEVNQDPFAVNIAWPSVQAEALPAEIAPGATLRVRDAITGKPLEGARVSVYGTDMESVTGSGGTCTLTGMPLGRIKLEAMAENHKAVYLSPKVVNDGADTLVFSLPPLTTGAVTGVVTDAETGEPLRNARIAPAANTLLGTSSDADGGYTLAGVPSGAYELQASHPQYLPETKGSVTVADKQTSGADFALTPRPETGSLEGTVRDAQTGEPIAGAMLRHEGSAATSTTDQNGRYTLSGLPAGLVQIAITAEGYPEAARTAGVLADQDQTTPTTTTADFGLDPQDPAPPVSVSKEISAPEGGNICMPDASFSLVIPPDALSDDAVLTVRSTQDGPDIAPGEELNMDPALGLSGIRRLGGKIQLIVEPAEPGAEIPSLQGWGLLMGQYAQDAAEAHNLAERSVFPYYWNGDSWTMLRPKPYELMTDPVNNLSAAVVDFSTTAAGAPVTAGREFQSPVMLASLEDYSPDPGNAKVYLFVKGAVEDIQNPDPPPHVAITDKDGLDAVTNAPDVNIPHPNALPLLVIEGWDKKSIIMNTGRTDPNDDGSRYRYLLQDLVNHNSGVYRPVFVSHNSRASMVDIGADLAKELHGKYLNQPGKIKGLPADPNDEDSGTFPYVNTLGYSFGGVISRSYQAHGQA
ncbi:MAG TPA: carboxypeptidase regulatory-like domain-containing protein, partial [Desulfosalsimonadaceae bacterium]|nr:carboxypeptidase regulatory-like domain-containing protein [Desulfosalsimonadaceae bacterium]